MMTHQGVAVVKNYDLIIHHPEQGVPFRRVDLVGCLDSHTVITFERSVDQILDQNTENVLLNLENLTYISSAGISALMSLTHRLRQQGGELALCKPSEKVLRVLRTLGFTSIFKIVSSDSEAKVSFTQ